MKPFILTFSFFRFCSSSLFFTSIKAKNTPQEILYTKNKYFRTSHLLAPSENEKEYFTSSVYSQGSPFDYSTPSDRIGTLYTPSCRFLKMKKAKDIAHSLPYTSTKKKSVGKKKKNSSAMSRMAPKAFKLADEISTIPTILSLETDEEGGDKLLPVEEEELVYPDVGSPTATRQRMMFERSSSPNHLMRPTPNTTNHQQQQHNQTAPLLKEEFVWEPEPIQVKNKDAGRDVCELLDGLSPFQVLMRRASSNACFQKEVEDVKEKGCPTASGAGDTEPVLGLQEYLVEGIVARVNGDEFGSLGDEVVVKELKIVNDMGEEAVCSSMIEYQLKDPFYNRDTHLDYEMLSIQPHWWTNKEYQLREWRVLRKTGVRSCDILQVYRSLDTCLMTYDPLMQEMQNIWYFDTLPPVWVQSLGPSANLPFEKLRFSDVGDLDLISDLPMSIDSFVARVERRATDLRDALGDCWCGIVGSRVVDYITQFDMAVWGEVTIDPPLYDEKGSKVTNHTQEENALNPLHQQLLDHRIKTEQLGLGNSNRDMNQLDFLNQQIDEEGEEYRYVDRLTTLLDGLNAHMSLQLRSLCQDSLEELASFFESFIAQDSNGGSVFDISVILVSEDGEWDENISGGLNQLEPPLKVSIQPSLESIKEHIDTILQQMILPTHSFPSIDDKILGELDDEEGSEERRGRMSEMRIAGVQEDEEVVQIVRDRIFSVLEEQFEGPAKLLEGFNIFEEVLNGDLRNKVEEALDEREEEDVITIDALQPLSLLAIELQNLYDQVNSVTEDIIHYPIFSLHTTPVKNSLHQVIHDVQEIMSSTIMSDNRLQMIELNSKYQEMANSLVKEPLDSAELKNLQDYATQCTKSLDALLDQYTSDVLSRSLFLQEFNFKISREDLQVFYTTFHWPTNIQEYLKRSYENQQDRKRDFEDLLEEDTSKLENELSELQKRVDTVADNSQIEQFRKIVERIGSIQRELEDKEERAYEVEETETLLEIPKTHAVQRVQDLQKSLEPLSKLWSTIQTFIESSQSWHEKPLADVNSEEAERAAEELLGELYSVGKVLTQAGDKRSVAKSITESMQNEIKELIQEQVPLMHLICNPGLRGRHWENIAKITGIDIPVHQLKQGEGEKKEGSEGGEESGYFTLSMMLDLELQQNIGDIEEVCVSASKEFGLEKAMDKMEEEWQPLQFQTKDHRNSGTQIIYDIDEIQQILDDQIVKTQAMRGSRFIKPFLARIQVWEKILTDLQDILDNWLKMQATWLYLEPIFGSDDIMKQMPTEGKLFRGVDNTWREQMKLTVEDPAVLSVAQRPGFLDSLMNANETLETIQKGLNDYLETKRLAFPRFFFLSNDELLEILSETKEPRRVQPHLKKCFDGISKLEFQDNLDITACFDPGQEKIEFPFKAVNQRVINPNESGGNVEKWLIEVEAIMRKSIAYLIDQSVADYQTKERLDWIQLWQGQVVLVVSQYQWVLQVEKAITDGVELGDGVGLEKLYELLRDGILETVMLVRGDLKKSLRTTLQAAIVLDVHNRDTVSELAELKVTSITDFDWLAQLRYYWRKEGESAKTGKPDSVVCKMINAWQNYGNEYVGNNGRLVITPLTDRCYRTLMGAIHLNLGGAPEGPAGTGKTETVKDLGKALAIQTVVMNCSDGLDYLAMGKFFKGLASSGAWACFDEFNRIQLEVLSVIAQQILCIQQAKVRQVDMFVFEGTNLPLIPTCCPFITMNPGYAGRAELPDNLKVLFRTVAMMVPDYAMIAEIILYSFGYENAKPLAVKIVSTYKLCSEQLSSQRHYDYGMRAVMAVLRAAGNLKRSDGHLPEDVLLLRSIIDVNLPKFLSPDVPLFKSIASDLFPGVEVEPPDRSEMRSAFELACENQNLQPVEYFWRKMVEVYEMMIVRHGFMIVGNPFGGKTSCWKTLKDTLEILHERYPEDSKYTKVLPFVMNPKAITQGQLYGQFDEVSHEWSDGVLAILYRNAAQNKIGQPEDRKWMLFDGPVDAIWIENMNTVLDDNKKLCLTSGEIIAMSDVMSMMFEPMDLLVASPATVSRCGMVYLEPEMLGWRPILKSWLHERSAPTLQELEVMANTDVENASPDPFFYLNEDEQQLIVELFDWLIEPCICFIRREGTEMAPTVDTSLVQSLINLLEGFLCSDIQEKLGNTGGKKKKKSKDEGPEHGCRSEDARVLKMRRQHIECDFLFSLIWSVGKSGNQETQKRFGVFLEELLVDFETIKSRYSSVITALKMREWELPNLEDTIHGGSLILPINALGSECYNVFYDGSEGKWKAWEERLAKYEIAPNTPYNSIVVPNIFTAQYNYLLSLLLPRRKPVLICGPTGTGKSVYVNNTITKDLPQDQFKALTLGFSAKTSANMTQDIIDGKLDKRRKGVYGPPLGQKCIIFVDDLSLPEVEEYGAQPPIELLRQFMGYDGWYDLKENTWRSIIDTVLVATMGPPGGGRNFITPRCARFFNLFCFMEFDDASLVRIFSTIVDWHLSSHAFSNDVKNLTQSIVGATLDTYTASMENLLPTPTKSHYTFNLRDFSRVIQGILLLMPYDGFKKEGMIKLWCHEALRVFNDRLVFDEDREWFNSHLDRVLPNHFGVRFYDLFKDMDEDNKGEIEWSDLRKLFFGGYMSEDGSGKYQEVGDLDELQEKMDDYLREYNTQSRKPMDLVLFRFAIEHISRISRIIGMPGGHALLVGVGGSGRQSLTRLATSIQSYSINQIEISKNYTSTEWREDLKAILLTGGTSSTPSVFLFSDTQIKQESFVEDISNMLNSGEVPNIFAPDEKMDISEQVRPLARQQFGKASQDMTPNELYSYFISRVKNNLHIVLAFSPIGSAFRDRLRKFPSLINCCAIDWFQPWPKDALLSVAKRFLADVELDSDDTRQSIVEMCQEFHTDTINLSTKYERDLKRINYVTPTSYLELITAYKTSLGTKRTDVYGRKNRYEIGLEKLAHAEESVYKMQDELRELQPVLAQSQVDTEALMEQIQAKLPGVEEKRTEVGAETAKAQIEKDSCQQQKDSVQADLAEALPALKAAMKALDTIKPAEINEVKALTNPPMGVRRVCESVCVMLRIGPNRVPDPERPGKKLNDYWAPSQKMLSDSKFIQTLKTYDKDNIDVDIVEQIKERFVSDETFTVENAAKSSKAAAGLCSWVLAMITYDRVAKIVEPKRIALKAAEEDLAITEAALATKQAELKEVEDELQNLQDAYEAAVQKMNDLEYQVDLCGKKIERATQLIAGLGGEKERWNQFVEDLSEEYLSLTGDVLVASGLMAYLGPFTSVFRNDQIKAWVKKCVSKGIPCSPKPMLAKTLGDPVKIRQWIIDGLPTDSFSVDNAIIVFNARRWPLMIDPQGQANKWIRNMEKNNNLHVIKLTDGNYLRTLENAIQFGAPVLLENVGEELDPSLEPLLLKQIFRQGGVDCIRLGDTTVEYSDTFRFYITSKLRNPHYLPEISVKVTLLNFMITPQGLQDQLLGIVVSQERPDLEKQKNELILESANNKRLLKEIEDKILHILSTSEGDILEDEEAITALKESKTVSDDIKEKQAIAEATEKQIDEVRMSYTPVAFSSQVLFFCIADLANIEPVYQYSLQWFINLFVFSIQKSEKSRDLEKRMANLSTHFQSSLYRNVCRSLLEKDKLTFSFLLTTRVLNSQGDVDVDEFFFLLTGGVAMENPYENPSSTWLSDRQWGELCRLGDLPNFVGLRESFKETISEWKTIYDSISPHDLKFPNQWSEKEGLSFLCLLRCIRPDKVVLAIQNYIVASIGEEFVKPPPFDLEACYGDSTCSTPLIFILSPGSDPMSSVLKAAELMKRPVDAISLGQGQGPIATSLIEKAKEKGGWVVLQNCHLAPSWMPTLEKICEEFNPEDINPNFRLWCTTYPTDQFPTAVLQNGVKLTIEPPKGLRNNLLGSYGTDPISDPDFFEGSSQSEAFKRLIFALCFFHALIQERRLYGPLGWAIPYEFNESDLRISVQQLQMFLEENEEIPYKALVYTAGECNYGGRVTDDKDRRTLHAILHRFYEPHFLDEDHIISGDYVAPPDGDYKSYIRFIEDLPLTAEPEVFGLHDNANITKDQNDTNALLGSVMITEKGGSGAITTGGGGSSSNEEQEEGGENDEEKEEEEDTEEEETSAGSSNEETIDLVASEILKKLPPPFDLEFASLKYPVRWDESMNTVFCQELLRFNTLHKMINTSLNNLRKAISGLVVMSAELEVLGNSLLFNEIPQLWKSKSYPSLKPLMSYINDLLDRLTFFQSWLDDRPPPVFWISGFFFTQAFLTGASQNFARKYTIPIDEVVFDFEMMESDEYDKSPSDGVFVNGLFLEGARWDKSSKVLEESHPKVLFSLSPLIWFKPVRNSNLVPFPCYDCPVYKTSDRRGTLSTTGHSTNFICFIQIPSNREMDHWVQRGVAMLTQLDD